MKTGLEATEISASSARQNLSKIIDAVRVAGERILVTQHRRPVAAVIGVEDLELLQLLEDHMDVAEARRRMREPADKISLEDLRSGSFLEDKSTRRKPRKARAARELVSVD
jgi:prevent-host-death family protein